MKADIVGPLSQLRCQLPQAGGAKELENVKYATLGSEKDGKITCAMAFFML